MFRSADGTTIVVPGKPDESELLDRITADDPELRMPPPKSGGRLTPEQIEPDQALDRRGGRVEGALGLSSARRGRRSDRARPASRGREIDRFIRARLAGERTRAVARGRPDDLDPPAQLRPDRPAARRRARSTRSRTTTRPDAYERLVDRLLASPHFGERMAIFWLDLVRFADTTGYHGDNHVDLYLFRDYVIRSFNANKPFDRFTIEQLAGDLLAGATDETRIASGYNRLLQTTQEGGAQAKEYMAKYSADRVRNVSTVWLGATMGCAECHDHKYDPFTTREFYSLAAFFADVKETAVGVQEPTRFPTAEQAAALQAARARASRRLKAIKKPTEAERRKLAELEKRLGELAAADSELAGFDGGRAAGHARAAARATG